MVELMIVVVIIGVLATLAIPAFQRIKQKAEATTVANNLRQFSGCFEQYSIASGHWPAEVDEHVVPDEVSDQLQSRIWMEVLPGGHQYDWDNGQEGVTAAISIRPSGGALTDPLFLRVDEIIDDGKNDSGNFRIVADRYMLILQN